MAAIGIPGANRNKYFIKGKQGISRTRLSTALVTHKQMRAKRSADEVERKSGITVDQLKGDIPHILLNEATRSIALRASAINEDQLKKAFQDILILTTNGPASHKHSTSTTYSSSSSIGSLMVDEDAAAYHLPSAKDIDDLRYIAQRMNSKGCLKMLISVYISERKAIVNADFKKLGIEKSSNNEIQRLGLEPLRLKTMRWIRAANVSLQILFPREKQLSEYIFKGLGNATDESCLIDTVRDPATQLFDFAEALSTRRRSPEKLKSILLLYRGLSARIPDIKDAFPSELGKTIHARATSMLSRIGETVGLTLLDFEDAVVREQSTAPTPEGTVHRLTKYVMGYISLILDNKDILEKLIITKPSMTLGESIIPDLERVPDLEGGTPLAIHVFWIIVTLRLKLEGLSKNYQDASLANLFMMNNIHYMVHKIKRNTTLKEMVGDNYLKKLTENIEQATTSYLRATWDRVLDCLRNEGVHVSGIFYSGVSGKIVKQRLKTFNLQMEDVHRDQVMWSVPDPELREKLFRSILDKLIRSYRTFLEQFGSHVERGKQPHRYIKYSEGELETIVRSLFCVS